jgi:putative inorganic carbon (hco3(-)) transporter
VVLARLATRRSTLVILPAVSLSVVPFVAVLIFETTLSADLGVALKATLRWAELGLVAFATANLLRTSRDVLIVVGAIAASLLGQALIGAVQFVLRIGPPSFAIGPFLRAYGTFGQPNPYGGYLAMGLPLLAAVVIVWWREASVLTRAALSGCLALGALAMGMSLSRGAWIGLVVAALTMALAWSRRSALIAGAVPLVGAVVVAASGVGLLPESLQARIAPALDYIRVFNARGVLPLPDTFAIVERMAHWQAAADMFVDRPLFGAGPGHYPIAYADYAILPYWRDALGHAHNIYLNVAAESGVAGLLGFSLMIAVWAVYWVKAVRGRANAAGSLRIAVALGVGGCIAAALTHSLFDNLFVHGLNVHVGVLLGLLAWSARSDSTGRTKLGRSTWGNST